MPSLIACDGDGEACAEQEGPDLPNDDYEDNNPSFSGQPSSSAHSRRRQKRAFQPGSRPAAELSLYIELVDGVWQLCEPRAGEGVKRCSRLVFFCYQRGTLKAPTQEQQAEWRRNPAGKAAHMEDEIKYLSDLMLRRSHPQAHDDQIAMENFALKYHTFSQYSKVLAQCEELSIKLSRASGEEREDLVQEAYKINIEALPVDVLKSVRQSLERKVGVSKRYGTVDIPGQGVGYPTVYGYISACALFHRLFGLAHADPSRDEIFRKSVKELRDAHCTEHVSVLDVLEDLPYIRAAVFQNAQLSHGEKLHLWAMILVALEHGCRISELSVYSPTLDQVKLPGKTKTHLWDTNGYKPNP